MILKGLSWFWLNLTILDHIAILDFKLWQYLKGCKMFCLAHFWQLKTACLIFTLEKYLICKYLVLFHKRKEKINNMPWKLFISFQNDWLTRKKVEKKKYYFPVSKCVENGRHQTGSDALVSPKKICYANLNEHLDWYTLQYINNKKNVVKFGLNQHNVKMNGNVLHFTHLGGHSLTTFTREGE